MVIAELYDYAGNFVVNLRADDISTIVNKLTEDGKKECVDFRVEPAFGSEKEGLAARIYLETPKNPQE